jgi:uncharacterized protein
MYKIVLDTNVLIDSIYDNHSFAYKILELGTEGNVLFYASHQISKEYQLIIDRLVKNENDRNFLQNFISRINVVQPKKKYAACEADQEDSKFVDVAVEARADFIISKDSHLLEMVEFKGTKMIEAEDFYYKNKSEKDESGDAEWGDAFRNLFR